MYKQKLTLLGMISFFKRIGLKFSLSTKTGATNNVKG